MKLILIFFTISLIANSNTEKEKIDRMLLYKFNKMMEADDTTRYFTLAPKFRNTLYNILKDKKSFNYNFDSLKSKINILVNKENTLRIFSWDENSGGSWHDMTSFIQFKTQFGESKVERFDSILDDELKNYIVRIYQIEEIKIGNKNQFLLFGWGSNGGGNQHIVSIILKIENDKLILCDSCFENKSNVILEAPRMYNLKIEYDPNKQELKYNELKLDKDLGNYYLTGEFVILKLIDGIFINTIKK